MNVATVTVSRIFKVYQGQARIAELNSKNPVKRVQGQRDQVSISNEAREALVAHSMEKSQELEAQDEAFQVAQSEENALLASVG